MTGSGRAILDLACDEKTFQRAVVDLATWNGWKVHWVWNSRHSPAGWPDIFAVRGARMVALELKTERGRITAAQEDWILTLKAAGVEAFFARPSEWDMIERLFGAPSARGTGAR